MCIKPMFVNVKMVRYIYMIEKKLSVMYVCAAVDDLEVSIFVTSSTSF